MSGQIVSVDKKFFRIKELVESPDTLVKIGRALPSHISAEKMARVFLTACTTTPKLLECDPASLMQAVMEASSLGLLPDGVLGHGYILPYKSKAKFIPGFRGLMDMARRSGAITRIDARVVYENDYFDYEYGLEPALKHKPASSDRGGLVAVYAAAKFSETNEVAFEVMSRAEVDAIRKRSPAGSYGPWVTDYEEMARKTVIRRLMKYLPLSPDIQAAVTADEYAEAGVLGKLMEQKVDENTGEYIDAESFETIRDLVAEPEADKKVVIDTEKKGKISSEEDEAFENAISNLRDRIAAATTADNSEKIINKLLGASGVESLTEIRSRQAREDFYNDVLNAVEDVEEIE